LLEAADVAHDVLTEAAAANTDVAAAPFTLVDALCQRLASVATNDEHCAVALRKVRDAVVRSLSFSR
jgi:hypothetical protein